MIIGAVKGDIHDIGKNLVGMMLEGAGFEVIDLGINNPVENYLAAIDEHQPDILGMSVLLKTTMPYKGVVIEEFDKRGILKDLPVMVGGAPLNQEFADAIKAHTYGCDATMSAELAKPIVSGGAPANDVTPRVSHEPSEPATQSLAVETAAMINQDAIPMMGMIL